MTDRPICKMCFRPEASNADWDRTRADEDVDPRGLLCWGQAGNCEDRRDAHIVELQAEVERLSIALRQTHATYCKPAWTDRGRHAPECLLYEVEP